MCPGGLDLGRPPPGTQGLVVDVLAWIGGVSNPSVDPRWMPSDL